MLKSTVFHTTMGKDYYKSYFGATIHQTVRYRALISELLIGTSSQQECKMHRTGLIESCLSLFSLPHLAERYQFFSKDNWKYISALHSLALIFCGHIIFLITLWYSYSFKKFLSCLHTILKYSLLPTL